jgi:hypothetical protein
MAMLDHLRPAWDCLLDQMIAAGFGILDRLASLAERRLIGRSATKPKGCGRSFPWLHERRRR